ncbi:MAG: peptidylprolyl isomerase [Bacteroidota bacterium]
MLKQFSPFAVLFFLIGMSACSPRPMFTFDGPEKPAPIATVTFENETKKADRYEWDFGDQGSSTEESPTYRFEESGKYTVTLKAFKGDKFKTTEQEIEILAPENCTVILETAYGNMTLRLFDATPLHRDNFILLAEEGYYDGLLFHRIIEGFMIQGGDPDSRDAPTGKRLGMGGPGYTIPKETVDTIFHVRGALAAARQPDSVNPKKASSGSQFYIVQGRIWKEADLQRFEKMGNFKYTENAKKILMTEGGTAQLDGNYTVFGQVIDGMEVIDKIAAVQRDRADRPIEDLKMKMRVVY